MRFDPPFKLGPFWVDSKGRLSPCEPANAPAFLYRVHNRVVRARLDQADDTTGRLDLHVTLARVRSTASAPDDMLRPRSFALVRWLEKTMPASWHVGLTADHRLWMETDAAIGLPITASVLITEITRFALDLAPYLDLMDEIGLTLADAAGA